MSDEPQRVKHNRALAEAFLADNGIEDTEPAVSRQVSQANMNADILPEFAYNPSITWFGDNGQGGFNLWMAYRFLTGPGLRTKVGIAEIGNDGMVVRHKPLDLQAPSVEDPKFFSYDGKLWLSWIEADWVNMFENPHSVVKFGILNTDWSLSNVVQPKYGKNDGSTMEKNWVFFEWNDRLHAIYRRSPEQVIIELTASGEVVNEYRAPSFSWAWGTPKGGTSPMPCDGKLVSFFHSTLDNEPPPFYRRYYVGACLMEPKPPFQVISVSKEPLLRGSCADALTSEQRMSCRQYKGRVVFPGGVAKTRVGHYLAVGINDSACAILHIKDLNL